MHGRRVFRGAFWVARTVRYPTHLQLAGAQVWSLIGSQSQAPALRLSLALRFCVSVVAEGDVDVEAIGVVDAEAEGVAKLDHVEVLADVEVVVVVDAGGDGVEIDVLVFARACGGTATGCRT